MQSLKPRKMKAIEHFIILTIQYAKELNKLAQYKRALTSAYLYGLRNIVAFHHKVEVPQNLIHYDTYKIELRTLETQGKVTKVLKEAKVGYTTKNPIYHSQQIPKWVYDIPAQSQPLSLKNQK